MSLHRSTPARQTWLEGYASQNAESTKTDVTSEHPCPVCRSVKLCYFDARPAGTKVVCRYIESDEPHPGLAAGGCAGKPGWFHLLGEGAPRPDPVPKVRRTYEDLADLNRRYVQELAEHRAAGRDLAVKIDRINDLPDGSYEAALADLGAHDAGLLALTIPEYDGAGRVIGVQRRYIAPPSATERKKRVSGTSSGLTIPRHFGERAKDQGVVYVVEGESDVVAMYTAGLCVVGQPGKGVGGDLLADLLAAQAPGTKVVVVEEAGAAREAIVTAGDLESRGFDAGIARTPAHDFGRFKDSREYLTDYRQEGRSWADRGADLRTALAALTVSPAQAKVELAAVEAANPNRPAVRMTHDAPPPPPGTQGGAAPVSGDVDDEPYLVAQRASSIKPKAVRWLVRDRVMRGALCMVCGPGGVGKSTLASTLIADLTAGRCALGESYRDPVKGEVVLLSAEEDPAVTIVPKLLAAGADMDAVHVNPVVVRRRKGADGKTDEITFSPEDIATLERYVTAHPKVVAVVIDPVSSYVGRTKLDDNMSSELRTALDPLNQMCIRRNVTVIALAHPNKNTKAAVADRMAGSSAYKDAARLMYVVARHPEREDARVMVKVKANTRVEETAVVYREDELNEDDRARVGGYLTRAGVDDEERDEILGGLRKVVFDDPEYVNEGTLLDPVRTSAAVRKAMDAIRDLIDRRRQMLVTDLIEELKSPSLSKASLERAMPELVKQGIERWRAGYQGPRWIGYPDDVKAPATVPGRHTVSRQYTVPGPVNPFDGLDD